MECLSACGEEVDGGVLERLRVEGVLVLGRGAAPGEGEVPREQGDPVLHRRGLLLEPELVRARDEVLPVREHAHALNRIPPARERGEVLARALLDRGARPDVPRLLTVKRLALEHVNDMLARQLVNEVHH